MLTASLHREDIKAVLRKRHGTVHAFAATRGLKPQAVADWLRGRTSGRVAEAIEAELQVAADEHNSHQSMNMDNSAANRDSHRLNARAR